MLNADFRRPLLSSASIQTGISSRMSGFAAGNPVLTARASTRIKVQHVAIEHFDLGWGVGHICQQHPGLTPAQVHAALSYCYDHQCEVDQDIRDGWE